MNSPETARLYDLLHDTKTDDVDFYVAMAQEEGGPVCELGAGSGRITVPIARAGVMAVGVDLSAAMLDRFKERVLAESERTQRRLQWAEGDMRSWGPDASFAQVFIPFRVFLFNLTSADRHRTLGNVHRILRPNGRLVLNVFHPSNAYMRQFSGDALGSWHEMEERWLADGTRLRLSHNATYDAVNKRVAVRFRWIEDDRVTDERFDLGYVYRDELILHLEHAGFAVEAIWGDFQRNPLEHEGQEMVVVARRVG